MNPNSLNTSSQASEVPISPPVPLLQPSNTFENYITGDVRIHPSAAIAPGVILQATANSTLIISAGVCIGMGSILQVHEGILEIEAGAILGAGVLVIGKGKIGANACIGSVTTILSCSVEPQQVVAAGSVLGDTSRQISADSAAVTPEAPSDAVTEVAPPPEPQPNQVTPTESPAPDQPPGESSNHVATQVYGQGNIKRLMSTLFPHSQSLSKPLQDDQPE